MSNRIITISREFGSGGRTIGRGVAEKLGIPCYDHEIIAKVAEKSGLSSAYIKEHGEYTHEGGWIGSMFSARDYRSGQSSQDILWTEQRNVVLELSEKGSCVIVGRCADHILKEKADLLTVFIHASMEKRAERIVKVYGESEETPEKRLRDKDKRRKAYYRLYTDMEWGIAQNYHIALDSGALGVDKCIEIITSLY